MRTITKLQLVDLIEAVSYMGATDWTKYRENGTAGSERISKEEGKKRQSDLLNILYGVKSELEENGFVLVEKRK